MPPLVPRELRVTYGSFVVGGASDYQLDAGDDGRDVLTISTSPTQRVVSFSVLTADHATDAAFVAACSAIESAFRDRRQRLLIQQGPLFASTMLDTNTDLGFEQTGLAVKSGSEQDTGRSRRYRVTITYGLPASHTVVFAGEAGLRDFSHVVTYLPSRVRTLLVTGTYTKLGSNSGTAQYQAQIDARVGAITTALTGGWKLTDETYKARDIAEAEVEFTRTYEEEVLTGVAVLHLPTSPDIARQRFTIRVGKIAPGDSSPACLRLVDVVASYEAFLKKGTITDPMSWWRSTGRPHVLAQALAASGGSGGAIVGEDVTPSIHSLAISAVLVLKVATGGDLLEHQISTTDSDEKPVRITPVWDGNPTSAHVTPAPQVFLRTIVEESLVRGSVSPPALGGAGGARRGAINPGGGLAGNVGAGASNALGIFGIGEKFSLDFGGAGSFLGNNLGSGGSGPGGVAPGQGLVTIKSEETLIPVTYGLPGNQLSCTRRRRTTVARLVRAVGGSTGGGGGGAASGGTQVRGAQQP